MFNHFNSFELGCKGTFFWETKGKYVSKQAFFVQNAFLRTPAYHQRELPFLKMPTFLDRIHRQITLGKVERHLFGFTYINMHALEAFQKLRGRRNSCHFVADIELDDFVAITRANVF